MNDRVSAKPTNESPDAGKSPARWWVQTAVFTLIWAASLFASSGRLDWAMAWAYLALFVAGQVVVGLVLVPGSPELIAERTQLKAEKRDLDRVLAGVMALFGPLAILIAAGLDARFEGLGQFPPALQIAALLGAALASALTIWAMVSNRFFYGVLRIAPERGHRVATGGPYGVVRHPGYAGAILFHLATPLMLGSLWALIPATLTVCAIVVRTALEDRTLRRELYGYAEYAQQTRYQLLPGVW